MTARKLARGALAFAAAALFAASASAQDARLYVFTSGPITIGKGILQNLAPNDPPIHVPVGFYVIKHPKGNILFDTGNNDRIITDPGYWGEAFKVLKPVNTPDVAIDVQLKKIGLSPDDIKYVVPSHLHWDHGGNIAKFPNSTIVVQKAEIVNAFWPEPGTGDPYLLGDVVSLRNKSQKVLALEGDLDLFGDGSVQIKKFVGHTPGSQVAQVRLKNTGLIVLTGDSLYFRENLEKNIPPNIVLAYDPTGIYKFYDYLRKLIATEKADYFSAHDPDAFKALKKPPAYYD